MDALDYAMKFGRYKITELLFYRTLSGITGSDLKTLKTDIHAKTKEAQYLKSVSYCLPRDITDAVIQAIKDRAAFDPRFDIVVVLNSVADIVPSFNFLFVFVTFNRFIVTL